MIPGLRVIVAFLVVSLTLHFSAAAAHDQKAPEYVLKAAFVARVAEFVEWPGPDMAVDAPVIISVIGDAPFSSEFERTFSELKIHGRVIKLRYAVSVADAEGSSVLFITASEGGRLEAILDQVADKPYLTVADSPGFANRGVMVNLVTIEQKLKLEINRAMAERVGLRISAMLLANARLVPDAGAGDSG